MKYLIDSDVLIQAKNSYYAFDVCPGFWDWLDHAHAQGLIASVEKVAGELKAGSDELAAWARSRPGFFLGTDQQTLSALLLVATWATSSADYTQAAAREFLDAADSQLVASASALGLTVVTQERAAATRNKIKIPNACRELEVPYTDVFGMLRAEGARFVAPQANTPGTPQT